MIAALQTLRTQPLGSFSTAASRNSARWRGQADDWRGLIQSKVNASR